MQASDVRTATSIDKNWSRALRALWYEAQGDWHRAHDELQDGTDGASAWVHAYLHRVEGDPGNAAYWYRLAKQPVPPATLTLSDEWTQIATALLAQS